MKGPRAILTLAGALSAPLLLLPTACERHLDTVFFPLEVRFKQSEGRSSESAAEALITVELSQKSRSPVSVDYIIVDLSASGHDDCEARDYLASNGSLTFAPGETSLTIRVRPLEDTLPEIDESFALELVASEGAKIADADRHIHVIEDDDRQLLLNVVEDFGARGDGQTDDTDAIQAAIDRAPSSDAVVLYFPPGEYLVKSLRLSADASYVAYDATLLQAPDQPKDAQMLHLEYSGDEDSKTVLFQGFTLDGQREKQGEFLDWEFQKSALLMAEADPDEKGRLRLLVEDLLFRQTGGNGLVLGTNTRTVICESRGFEVFTDVIKLSGGASELKVRSVSATATQGTAGMAFTGRDPGYNGSQAVDLLLERVLLATGDLEIDVQEGARVVGREVILESSPFYLRSPRSSVHFIDSSFVMGPSLYRFNRIVAPYDVYFEGCHFTVTEKVDPSVQLEEADRILSAVQVTWDDLDYAYSNVEEDRLVESLGGQELLFDNCSFELAEDVESEDTAFVATALASTEGANTLRMVASKIGEGFEGLFSPQCEGCVRE